MKRIIVTGSLEEIEKLLNEPYIKIISIDIKPCEQSMRFQEYIMCVIVYEAIDTPVTPNPSPIGSIKK